MGFHRFGSFGGGSLEIFDDIPKIVTVAPERKIRNPLGRGSLAGVEIKPVAETKED